MPNIVAIPRLSGDPDLSSGGIVCCVVGGQPMVRGTVSDALAGVPTVPSQGMSPHDVELSQYDHMTAADSVAGPSMQLRYVQLRSQSHV